MLLLLLVGCEILEGKAHTDFTFDVPQSNWHGLLYTEVMFVEAVSEYTVLPT